MGRRAQIASAQAYGDGPSGRFRTFTAYEWHAQHLKLGDTSPLHRVVLFRAPADPDALPPILPGDVSNVPPQCMVRFLVDTGLSAKQALIVPHMMSAQDANIDWDLTYADTDNLHALRQSLWLGTSAGRRVVAQSALHAT